MSVLKLWENGSYDFVQVGNEAVCNQWRGFGASKLLHMLKHRQGTQTQRYTPISNVEVIVTIRPNRVKVIAKGGVFIAIADTANALPDSKNGTLLFSSANSASPYPTVKGLSKPFVVQDKNLGIGYWHNDKDAVSYSGNEIYYQQYKHAFGDGDFVVTACFVANILSVFIIADGDSIPQLRFYKIKPKDEELFPELIQINEIIDLFSDETAFVYSSNGVFSDKGDRIVFNYGADTKDKFVALDIKYLPSITVTRHDLFSLDYPYTFIGVNNISLAVSIIPDLTDSGFIICWEYFNEVVYFKYYKYAIDSYVSVDEATFSLKITDKQYDIKSGELSVIQSIDIPEFFIQTDFNNRFVRQNLYYVYRLQNKLEVFHRSTVNGAYDGVNGNQINTVSGIAKIDEEEQTIFDTVDEFDIVGSPFTTPWISEGLISDDGITTTLAISLDQEILPQFVGQYVENGKALLTFDGTFPYLAFSLSNKVELTGQTDFVIGDGVFNANISVRSI